MRMPPCSASALKAPIWSATSNCCPGPECCPSPASSADRECTSAPRGKRYSCCSSRAGTRMWRFRLRIFRRCKGSQEHCLAPTRPGILHVVPEDVSPRNDQEEDQGTQCNRFPI